LGRPGTALAQQTSAEQVLEVRIQLDVVADIVGAEQIARVGESTVSLALLRLSAVTVVRDQYISCYPTDALSLKFRIQNMLDEKLLIEQGGVDVIEQTVGSTFKVDVAYRF
jgi:hypothetical protein